MIKLNPKSWLNLLLTGLFLLGGIAASHAATDLTLTIPAGVVEGDGLLVSAGTVTCSEATSEDLTVDLSSDDVSEVLVPETVTVPAGHVSAAFDLTVVDDFDIDGTQTVTLTVSAPDWTSGSTTIEILDNDGINRYPAIAAGFHHTLALKEEGTIWTWGYNGFGQLGDGTAASRTTPLQNFGLTDVDAVAAGYSHTLALKADGSVWAWGYNWYGQLGVETGAYQFTPVQVIGLDDVKALAAGYFHTAALKDDGTVWTWGYNVNGQLGDGTTTARTTPVQVSGLTNVIAIAAGFYHTIAVKDDGTVWAWGQNSYGQLGDGTTTGRTTPVQASGLVDVTAVDAGLTHSLAVKDDGTVWTWGYNSHGQLGDGTKTRRTIPVQVSGLADVMAVAGGEHHSLAVEADGTVWAWGRNSYGQLGDGSTNGRTIPVQVSYLANVIAIAAGHSHSLALRSDGTVWTWGYNSYGQLGDGTTIGRTTPVKVVETGDEGFLNLMFLSILVPTSAAEGDGFLPGQGTVSIARVLSIDLPVNLVSNDISELLVPANVTISAGNTSASFDLTIVDDSLLDGPQTASISAPAPGYYPSAVTFLIDDNETAVLSLNMPAAAAEGDGLLAGQGTVTVSEAVDGDVSVSLSSNDTTEVDVLNTAIIPAGQTSAAFDLMIVDDTEIDGRQTTVVTASVTGWTPGSGSISIEDNETTDLTVTLPANATELDGHLTNAGVVSISGTLTSDLVVDLSSNNSSEVTVAASVTIPGGQTSTAFDMTITDDTAIDGTQAATITASAPGWISGSDIIGIYDNDGFNTSASSAAGADHSVALNDFGIVWSWGKNSYGQIGDGTTTERNTPAAVTDLNNVIAITAGYSHTMALKADGTVWAWGQNFSGQLGDGTTSGRATPVQVSGLTDVIAIAAATNHSVALKADRTVWTWGYNGQGQLGDGTNSYRFTPVQVSGLADVIAIAAGYNHTAALKANGTVWAWGKNSDGQLGDDTTAEKTIPVQVSNLAGVIAIAAGSSHTLALKNDGTVWAWGYNNYGQLGDGTTTTSTTPVQVAELTNIITIAAGRYHTLALKADRTAWAWGYNGQGQLGDGTRTSRFTPVQVSDMINVIAIDGGLSHSLAIKADGSLWTWGANYDGQLGDGTTTVKTTPVPVNRAYGDGLLDLTSQNALTVIVPQGATEGDGVLSNAGTVSTSATLTSDLVVDLTSSDTSEVTLPTTVTISSGQSSTAFDLTILDDAGLDHTQTVTVTAAATGWISGSDTIEVADNDNSPPNAPMNPVPADDATDVATGSAEYEGYVFLSWTGGDPNEALGDTVTYDIYLGAGGASTKIADNISETNSWVTLGAGIEPGTTYYWRVTARDSARLEAMSPEWQFTSRAPDLVVADITYVPATVILPNQLVIFIATIQNIGAAPVVAGFQVDFRVGGATIGSKTVDQTLSVGESTQLIQTWTAETGEHTIEVMADISGTIRESHEDNNSLSQTLPDVIDPAPPELVSTVPLDASSLQQNSQIVIILFDQHGIVDDTAVINSFSVTDGSNQDVSGNIAESDDRFTFTPSTAPMPDGAYQVSFTAADVSGNAQAHSFSFTVDTIPPPAPTIDPVGSPTNNPNPTINGTKEAYAAILLNETEMIGNTAETAWQHAVTLLSGPNTFTFAARDRAGNLSESTSVDIVFDDVAPQEVNTLTLDNEGDGISIKLDWSGYDEASHGDIASYRVYAESANITSLTGLTPKTTLPAGTLSYTVENLTRATTYWFAVVSVDLAGNTSGLGTPVYGAPVDIIPPEGATNLQVDCFVTRLVLNWDLSADTAGDLAGYNVYFDGDSTGIALDSGQKSFVATDLNPGTSYTFSITSVDADGNQSEPVSVSALTLPGNPSDLSAVSRHGSVDLSWSDVTPQEYIDHYRIYVSETNFDSVKGLTPRLTTTSTSAKINDLANGAVYYFAITTVSTSGGEHKSVISVSAIPLGEGVDGYTVLMIHSDNEDGSVDFEDSSSRRHTIAANGDAHHNTAQARFGRSSLYYDGSGDYLEIADDLDWDFGTGPFTMEAWIWLPSGESWDHNGIIGQNTNDNVLCNVVEIYRSPNGSVRWLIRTDSSGVVDIVSNAISTDAWHHVAAVRDGDTFKLFIDGILAGSEIWSGSVDVPDVMRIGLRDYGTVAYFKGYIDEVRITKGLARWTENFTPPTSPYEEQAKHIMGYIDHTKVDENLIDFPVLIHLSASSGVGHFDASHLFNELTSYEDRKKIAVRTANGRQCYTEIESWDVENKEAWLWVKVPTVSATTDTILSIYYDKTMPENLAYVGEAADRLDVQVAVDIGAEGTYDISGAYRPWIIKDADEFKMWYSGYDGSTWRTMYAKSTDGVTWTDHQLVLDIRAEGRYDTVHAYAPSVIKENDTYKMWYSGYDGANYRILYAISTDGTTWSDHRLAVDIAIEGTYDTTRALHPCVIKDDGIYKMWYAGYDGTNYRSLYATSVDGIIWSNHQMVVNVGAEGTFDTKHAYACSVIKYDGTYQLSYSGHDGSHWRLFSATSPDGINWSNFKKVLDIGTQGTYDTGNAANSYSIKEGKAFRRWYSGYGGSKWRILYTETLADIWTTPSQSIWDDKFVGVWHMSQDPSGVANSILDSTKNSNHGTPYGSMGSSSSVTAQIGKAIAFDGIDDEIKLASNVTFGSNKTFAWIGRSAAASTQQLVAGENWYNRIAINPTNIVCQYDGPDFQTHNWQAAHATDINQTNMYHVVWDDTLVRVYVDGVLASTASSITESISVFNIGGKDFDTAWSHYNGFIDDLVVSDGVRSPSWIGQPITAALMT